MRIRVLIAIAALLLTPVEIRAQFSYEEQVQLRQQLKTMQNRIDALEAEQQRLEKKIRTHERLIDDLRGFESVRQQQLKERGSKGK